MYIKQLNLCRLYTCNVHVYVHCKYAHLGNYMHKFFHQIIGTYMQNAKLTDSFL